MTVLPGMGMENPLANIVLNDKRVKSESRDSVRCMADIWIHSARWVEGSRANCPYPPPDLELEGNILAIRGPITDTVNCIEFEVAGAPRSRISGKSDLDEPLRISDEPEEQVEEEPVEDYYDLDVSGPEVKIRWQFNNDEVTKLSGDGLFAPGGLENIPEIIAPNLYEDIPVTCKMVIVPPTRSEDMPLVFIDIEDRFALSMSMGESGYALAEEFEPNEFVRMHHDLVPPEVNEALVEKEVSEQFLGDILSEYGAEEIESDKREDLGLNAEIDKLFGEQQQQQAETEAAEQQADESAQSEQSGGTDGQQQLDEEASYDELADDELLDRINREYDMRESGIEPEGESEDEFEGESDSESAHLRRMQQRLTAANSAHARERAREISGFGTDLLSDAPKVNPDIAGPSNL